MKASVLLNFWMKPRRGEGRWWALVITTVLGKPFAHVGDRLRGSNLILHLKI
jgi:hypothetical protein